MRWTRTGDTAHAFVDAPAGTTVALDVDPAALLLAVAVGNDGASVDISSGTPVVTVLEPGAWPRPHTDFPRAATESPGAGARAPAR